MYPESAVEVGLKTNWVASFPEKWFPPDSLRPPNLHAISPSEGCSETGWWWGVRWSSVLGVAGRGRGWQGLCWKQENAVEGYTQNTDKPSRWRISPKMHFLAKRRDLYRNCPWRVVAQRHTWTPHSMILASTSALFLCLRCASLLDGNAWLRLTR